MAIHKLSIHNYYKNMNKMNDQLTKDTDPMLLDSILGQHNIWMQDLFFRNVKYTVHFYALQNRICGGETVDQLVVAVYVWLPQGK